MHAPTDMADPPTDTAEDCRNAVEAIAAAAADLAIALNHWVAEPIVDRIDLAELAVRLREELDALDQTWRAARGALQGLLADGDELRLRSGWTVTPGRPSTSWRWDADDLRRVVATAAERRAHDIDLALADRIDPAEKVRLIAGEIVGVMFDVLSNSQSSGWKSGGLKQLGITPSRYREKTDATPALAVLHRPTLQERIASGETF